jgi:hypothetical protein
LCRPESRCDGRYLATFCYSRLAVINLNGIGDNKLYVRGLCGAEGENSQKILQSTASCATNPTQTGQVSKPVLLDYM